MAVVLAALGVFVVFSLGRFAATSDVHNGATEADRAVARTLTVRVEPGERRVLDRAAVRLGLEVVSEIDEIGVVVLRAADVTTVDRAIEGLERAGFGGRVERDVVMRITRTPNDPSFPMLWGLRNTGSSSGVAGADVDAESAWNLGTGSREVVVAVVDTGLDVGHPDIAANAWVNEGEIRGNRVDDDGNGYVDDINGWNFLTGSPAVYTPLSGDTHATHVAGTIAAAGDNGVGVTGVAWRARVMALPFLDSNDGGNASDAAKAILYAINNGADVINCSFSGTYSSTLNAAILEAAKRGVIVVAAAANDKSDIDRSPVFPASTPATNVVAVVATTRTDALAAFSNWGAATCDIGAPGQDIFSTIPGNRYSYMSGTSMAAPHVSGAVALMKAIFPERSAAWATQQLLDNAERIASLAGRCNTGGRLDVGAAVRANLPAPGFVSPGVGGELIAGVEAVIELAPPSAEATQLAYEAVLECADPARPGATMTVAATRTAGDPLKLRVAVPPVSTSPGVTKARTVMGGAVSAWTTRAVRLVVDHTPPKPPTSVVPEVLGDGSVALRWSVDPADGVAATRVVRRTDIEPAGRDEGLVVTQTAGTVARDAGLADGETAYYALFSVDDRGNWSQPATAQVEAVDVVPPPTVTGVVARQVGSSVVLRWNPVADDVSDVRIVRRFGEPSAEHSFLTSRSAPCTDTLTTDVTETVVSYAVIARDRSGNEAEGATCELLLDLEPPAGSFTLAGGAAYVTGFSVTVASSVSGATEMRFDTGFGFRSWQTYTGAAIITVPGVGTHLVRAEYRDTAGNVLSLARSITALAPAQTYNPPPAITKLTPSGTFSVAAGRAVTTSHDVTLDSVVTDAQRMRFDVGRGWGAWLPYDATVYATLPPEEGARAVRAQYDNDTGGLLELSDSILVDTLGPSRPATPVVESATALAVRLRFAAPSDTATLTVHRQTASGDTTRVATLSADATGFVDARPPLGVVGYRVLATDTNGNDSDCSPVVNARVRSITRITIGQTSRRTARVALSTQLGAPLTGRRVSVQVKTASGWKTVARPLTGLKGTATATLRLSRPASVRAVFGGEADHTKHTSSTIRFRP